MWPRSIYEIRHTCGSREVYNRSTMAATANSSHHLRKQSTISILEQTLPLLFCSVPFFQPSVTVLPVAARGFF